VLLIEYDDTTLGPQYLSAVYCAYVEDGRSQYDVCVEFSRSAPTVSHKICATKLRSG
jgi:hypothetical protein